MDYKLSMRQCHAVAKMANIIMECINGNIIQKTCEVTPPLCLALAASSQNNVHFGGILTLLERCWPLGDNPDKSNGHGHHVQSRCYVCYGEIEWMDAV